MNYKILFYGMVFGCLVLIPFTNIIWGKAFADLNTRSLHEVKNEVPKLGEKIYFGDNCFVLTEKYRYNGQLNFSKCE